jgi:Zn-dependent peptidase ImmA (M78 family)
MKLIRATGEFVDPRSSVITQARKLNAEYGDWDGNFSNPLKRLAILASLRGLRVEEMDRVRAQSETRDAVIIPTDNGQRAVILFNPTRPSGRVAFSIAHEIAHTFFPNSTNGARFRSICAPGSREGRELESLCDLGASELLMPQDEFLRVTGGRVGLDLVDVACAAFGSSYEATVFRLATSYPGLAAAGLVRYRRRLAEERQVQRTKNQGMLFAVTSRADQSAEAKYRRQSFFTSELCDTDEHIVRWNKSFESESCVYRAGREHIRSSGKEALPNNSALSGYLEAAPAPFQRNEADPRMPDVMFIWWR